ncbi:NAD(P)H-dependent oxidoreductase [Rhodovibrionaceae bacterium A322]
MRKIFILSGHLGRDRFGHALAASYEAGALASGAEVKRLNLDDMVFDPAVRSGGYGSDQPLEEDILAFQQALVWCDHWVILHPLWWGGLPGPLKGLFDRALLPGFAFRFQKGKPLPEKLLKGRTARVLMTSDTPSWYLNWVYGAGGNKALKKQVLNFIGFEKSRFHNFGAVKGSSDKLRTRWLAQAEALGRKDGGSAVPVKRHVQAA